MNQVTPRVALVTGAANGIGRATAVQLLHRGWTVGAFDIAEAGLADLHDLAAGLGAQVITGKLDVAEPASWEAALDLMPERLDLLVNNAGILSSGPFHETPIERHRAIVDVNVTGVLNGAHSCFERLRHTPGATMVNLCSASALYGQPNLVTYSATKFAVKGITEALDLEWAQYGIRVLDLMPLFVQTQMVTDMKVKALGTLGVQLGEDDVAAALIDAVDHPPATFLARHVRNVHRPIGSQAKLFAALAQLSPNWANRLVNKRLAGH